MTEPMNSKQEERNLECDDEVRKPNHHLTGFVIPFIIGIFCWIVIAIQAWYIYHKFGMVGIFAELTVAMICVTVVMAYICDKIDRSVIIPLAVSILTASLCLWKAGIINGTFPLIGGLVGLILISMKVGDWIITKYIDNYDK